MSQASAAKMDPDEQDRAILAVLAEGRSNPYHLRQRTSVTDKNDMHGRLSDLSSYGYVRKVNQGLYQITDHGREAIGAESDLDAVRNDLRRALEHREWSAVEDAAARLGVETDG